VESLDELGRIEEIVSCLIKNELYALVEVLELKTSIPFHKRISLKKKARGNIQARTLRNVFEELGGAFLKLGQMISMRPDLVGSEFSREFDDLLDKVPAEAYASIVSVINGQLPGGMHNFERFDVAPVAAGSIAQVHHAVVRAGVLGKSCVEVAVKVERPSARKRFETDIALMMTFAKNIVEHYDIGFVDVVGIVEEFSRYTRKELDLNHEASSMMRFGVNFSDSKTIIVPKVYTQLCTSNVLVMEMLKGETIMQASKLTPAARQRIIRDVFTMCFKQLFEDGFFHADMHAGNILLLHDNKIGLLDYGIVGYIDKELKEKLSLLFVSLVNGDLDRTADALLDLNIGSKVPDRAMLKEGIYYTLADYYGTSLEHIEFSKIIYGAIDTAVRSRIKIPAQLVLFAKSLTTMEGFCKTLDPEFNIVLEAKPYVKRLVMRELNPVSMVKDGALSFLLLKKAIINTPQYIKEFTGQIRLIESSIVHLDSKFTSMQYLMIKITKSLIYGILMAALLVSSALLVNVEPSYGNISILSIVGFCAALVFMVLVFVTLRGKSKD